MCWKDNARFNIFCQCDVFVEDGHYLYVESMPFNYNGMFTVREYSIVKQYDNTNAYIYCDICGADNEYISNLDMAPWEIARDIIERELARWEMNERGYEDDEDDIDSNASIIHDARWSLMHYATPNEKFNY